MTVPDFQSFMLPLLKFAADGNEHRQGEAADALAQHFKSTEADRKEMLRSGRQTRFDNRVVICFWLSHMNSTPATYHEKTPTRSSYP